MYPQTNFSSGKKWIKSLTRERIQHFTGGHFASVNLSAVLDKFRSDSPQHVKLEVWSAPGRSKPTFQEAMKQPFRDTQKGEKFGPSCECRTNHWFKVTINIPSEWTSHNDRIQFEFDPESEAMIYSTDGVPLQGITGGSAGDRRVEYILPISSGTFSFVIESSCNGMFGVPCGGDAIEPPDMHRYYTLVTADIVVPNQEAWKLFYDFKTLKELASSLPGDSPLQNKALSTANQIMNVFKATDLRTISAARKLAESVLGQDWEKNRENIFNIGTRPATVWGIGHCHIDTAWLWPYSVTQQKVARSWSTQVDLMDRYQEHRFACSSAQQYKWLEQLYPALFEKVKAKVLSGQFQPVGGAWVEHDTNMPSGEALCRQTLFGQRYFESRFGKRCETGWLPDSFGLTGALPQILRDSGMKWFFTQKLSWNNINVFPHTTFNWVGIDGTPLLVHMTPVDNYASQVTVGEVRQAITNHKNLESSSSSLLVFGNGDGGGGPLAAMLESMRRIRATANTSGEIPTVTMGNTVDEFFQTLEMQSGAGRTLPNWHGELYLEFHRGTYTSHGSIKKGNRKSEILMRDIEHAATLASIFPQTKKEYVYPKEKIDENWEKVLLNQFHDVLPGSAIGMVYEDAEKLYAEVARDGKVLLEAALGALFRQSLPLSLGEPLLIRPKKGKLVAFNPIHAARRDVVSLPLTGPGGMKFKSDVIQVSKDGSVGYAIMAGRGRLLHSIGRLLHSTGKSPIIEPASARIQDNGDFTLGNPSLQMTISNGRIVSLLDVKCRRELIPHGLTGGMVIYDDKPNYWDAWDVEIHHLETPHSLQFSNIKIVEQGPLRASLAAEVKYGKSTILVTISLDAVAVTEKPEARPWVRFDAQVDWHQRHEFLKFELPVNIHSPTAVFETQFGYVSRPTHRNTSWDAAKFEVCGHKYADLSEFGYGVALLSESKYGFAADGQTLRLSLLRAATAPDAEQDQGKHEFSWAVMPHIGHFLQSDVPITAAIFNSPSHLRYLPDDAANILSPLENTPFVLEGASNVILENIKRGEDDFVTQAKEEGTLILRLYEAYGGHAEADLRVSGLRVVRATLSNILEDDIEELPMSITKESDLIIPLSFRGFQVLTVKLVLDVSESARGDWVQV